MTNIDLKDAYLSVPIHELHQRLPPIYMERKKLSVQSYPVWAVHSPKNIQKVIKASSSASERRLSNW